jgi:hypothetical protein
MAYFDHVISREELKTAYRRLVMAYHPDRGGDVEIMKKINYEYARRIKILDAKPNSLNDLVIGHMVLVNNVKSIVTEVYPDYFKAKSLETNREAYFSKTSGYAMLNYKFRAELINSDVS